MTWRPVIQPCLLAVCVGITSQTLEAQAGSCRLQVQVAGTDASPLAGAEVAVGGSVTRTDSAGRGVLTGLSAGPQSVLVRRLGFAPLRSVLQSDCGGAGTMAVLRLTPRPPTIAQVTVRATEKRRYTGPMAGFWERRERGDGTFFTAADIDRRNVQHLADLLRTVAGWGRSRSTEQFSDAVVRNQAIRMGAVQREPLRQAAVKCFPTVVVDGMAATMAELNVDGIDPRSLSGVEVYPDAARTPSEFWGTGGQGRCGVVAVWSRSLDNMRHTPLDQQAALIDTVYSADDVDEPATMNEDTPFQVLYPVAMRRKNTDGDATVSVIVLPTGEPFLRSASVVNATHEAFGAAVIESLGTLRFRPARREGKIVNQRALVSVHFDAQKK